MRWHIVVGDSDGDIVGQFDIGSETGREYILDNLPSDLRILTEREVSTHSDITDSVAKLSDNAFEWDNRLKQL